MHEVQRPAFKFPGRKPLSFHPPGQRGKLRRLEDMTQRIRTWECRGELPTGIGLTRGCGCCVAIVATIEPNRFFSTRFFADANIFLIFRLSVSNRMNKIAKNTKAAKEFTADFCLPWRLGDSIR
jgi:hypothetical protein